MENKACKTCGTMFPVQHGNHKYCSARCLRAGHLAVKSAWNRLQYATGNIHPPKPIIYCTNCGTLFLKPAPNSRFCSDLCRTESQNARHQNDRARGTSLRKLINERERARRAEDPEYRILSNLKKSASRLTRRHTDPEYHQRTLDQKNTYHRHRMATDPIYRDKVNKQKQEGRRRRRANDPEYRSRMAAKQKERKRIRMASDPEYCAMQKEKQRVRSSKLYHRKQAILAAVMKLGLIDIGDLE